MTSVTVLYICISHQIHNNLDKEGVPNFCNIDIKIWTL